MNIIMIPRINIYIIKILVIIIIFSTIYQWNSLFNDNDSNKTLLYDDELDDVSPNDALCSPFIKHYGGIYGLP